MNRIVSYKKSDFEHCNRQHLKKMWGSYARVLRAESVNHIITRPDQTSLRVNERIPRASLITAITTNKEIKKEKKKTEKTCSFTCLKSTLRLGPLLQTPTVLILLALFSPKARHEVKIGILCDCNLIRFQCDKLSQFTHNGIMVVRLGPFGYR